jgi:catechol 2,3-dioxygenase-like lactoylglutathione lyase family enzyme
MACVGAVCLILQWSSSGVTLAQASEPTARIAPKGEVLELSEFMLYVANLDRSIAFYRDVIGLELPPRPNPPAWTADPEVLRIHNTVGGAYRVATHKLPGAPATSGLELVEYKGIGREPVQPRIQDVGAATIILFVRDVDALLARLKKSGAPVVTASGAPVTITTEGTRTRAVIVKDPDGSLVELRQIGPVLPTNDPSSRNVIDTRFGITVADAEKAAHFYRDVFGFELDSTTPFSGDKNLMDLTGTRGAQMRTSTLRVSGSSFLLELLEFKGIERKNIRPADALRSGIYVLPGVGALKFNVRDMRSLVKTLRSAGSTVVSTGGEMIEHVHNRDTHAVVRDPNDLFVQLAQRNAPQ